MKKSHSIHLSIPDPCTQSWDAMQIASSGRHCAHCVKTVMDFSRMTDAELLDFFKKNTGSSCGRFRNEQLDRTLKALVVPKSNGWARLVAGFLLVFGLSRDVHGQNRSDHYKRRTNLGPGRQTPEGQNKTRSFTVKGTLKDQKGSPVVNATVTLHQHDSNTILGRTLTDYDGDYELFPIMCEDTTVKYDILFQHSGSERMYTELPFQPETLIVNGVLHTGKTENGGEKNKATKYIRPLVLRNSNGSGIIGKFIMIDHLNKQGK